MADSLIFSRALNVFVNATATIVAGKPVTFAGAVAPAGSTIAGVASTDAGIGDSVPLIIVGTVNVTADGAVSAGDDIEVGTSGAYRTLSSGVKIGRALTSASGGATFTLFVLAASDLEGVSSFNGRTGAVSPMAADYTAAQITNAVDKTSSYADPPWITSLAGSKISGSITGNAANITGVASIANGGTNATTAAAARTNLNAMQNWVPFPPTHSSPGNPGDCAYNPATGEIAICFLTNSWAKFAPSSTTF